METNSIAARSALRAKARSFLLQVGDFVGARILPKQEAFRVLKQILNFSPLKLETRDSSTIPSSITTCANRISNATADSFASTITMSRF